MLCVPADEIVWIEAAGNYVQIHTAKKTHLVRHTVKAMQAKLDPQRFIRVRPSAIVCRDHVEAFNARHGGDYVVVMTDGTEIRSSRSFREQVEQALGQAAGTARSILASRRRRRGSRVRPIAGPVTTAPANTTTATRPSTDPSAPIVGPFAFTA